MEKVTVSDKELSNKNEENNYEPFTFELKSDLKCEPDKAEHRSSSSSSSSTNSEDDDDFIQLDTISFTNSFPNPRPNNGHGAVSHKNPNPDVKTANSSNMWAPLGTGRIPSSVFTTQSKVPMEWSVASAESLFSLNFSNSSFTRENASVSSMPQDSLTPTKPGSAISAVPNVSLELYSGPLVVLEETGEGANNEVLKESGVELETYDGKLLDGRFANSRRSDGSVSSLQSFAFPVLTGHESAETIKVESQSHDNTESIKLGSQPHESTESIKVESQPQPELPSPSPSQSVSVVPESETKSEPKPELLPTNSGQLTQPPQPQVMAASDAEERPTVMETTFATNENADTQAATKTSSTTSSGSGSSCSCCSFCS